MAKEEIEENFFIQEKVKFPSALKNIYIKGTQKELTNSTAII